MPVFLQPSSKSIIKNSNAEPSMQVFDPIPSLNEELIKIRQIHAHPELCFEEVQTAAL